MSRRILFPMAGAFSIRLRQFIGAYRWPKTAPILSISAESRQDRGQNPISIEEELRRTIPVIEALAKEIRIPISIDTYKADVAKSALDAGAEIVNDISGLRYDPRMPKVVAEYKAPVVIMHMKGTPKDMQKAPVYEALTTGNTGLPSGRDTDSDGSRYS